jgi:hypothetical protein
MRIPHSGNPNTNRNTAHVHWGSRGGLVRPGDEICIVIAVGWRPTWEFIARGMGLRPSLVAGRVLPPAIVWLGTCVIPLGPQSTAHRLATNAG